MNDKLEKFRDYIWYNGEFIAPADANINIMAHTLHYGSGFFEGIKAYETSDGQVTIFRLEEHMQRLLDSARVYYVDVPFTKEELVQAAIDVVKKNNFKNCYIRPFIFVGEGFRAIDVDSDLTVNVAISAWELDFYNKDYVDLSVVSYRRPTSQQFPMQAKAIGNYMNSMLIRREAKLMGSDDGIALDMNGNVSEVSTANIFLVKDNVIITPDLSSSILNGLTRLSVIEIAQDLGYAVEQRTVGRDELYYADEVFITGTASEIKYCKSIDKLPIGNGEYPIARKLQKMYLEMCRGEHEKYQKWLTYVK